jgi:hypothetical protein
MVHVQESSLSPLQQHSSAGPHRTVNQEAGVSRQWLEPRGQSLEQFDVLIQSGPIGAPHQRQQLIGPVNPVC